MKKQVLYICVATAQNTINVLPLRKWKKDNLQVVILSSTFAKNNAHTARLNHFFQQNSYDAHTILFSEDRKMGNNIEYIIDKLDSHLNKKNIEEVWINAGGGQKSFTFLLMGIMEKIKIKNKFIIYPDKTTEKNIIIPIDSHNLMNTPKYENIKYEGTIDNLISLYFSAPQTSYQSISENNFHRLFTDDIISLYTSPGLRQIFFKAPKGNRYDYERSKQFFEKLDEKDFKNEFVQKLIQDFLPQILKHTNLSLHPSGNKNKLFHTTDSDIDINVINTITKKIIDLISKASFWKEQIKNENITVPLSTSEIKTLKKINPQITLKSNTISLHKNTIKELLESHFSEFIKKYDHGQFLELFTAYQIDKFLKENTGSPVIEVKRNYVIMVDQPDKGLLPYAEFDFIILTRRGNLYFLECKSNDYDKNKMLANYYKAKKSGSIYMNYFIILPVKSQEDWQYGSLQNTASNALKNRIKIYSCFPSHLLDNTVKGLEGGIDDLMKSIK